MSSHLLSYISPLPSSLGRRELIAAEPFAPILILPCLPPPPHHHPTPRASYTQRPYTKSVVQALQLRIDTLESQLAAALSSNTNTNNHTPSGTLTPNGGGGGQLLPNGATLMASGTLAFPPGTFNGPQLAPRPVQLDAFQGGLALNAHGELRFYVGASSAPPARLPR